MIKTKKYSPAKLREAVESYFSACEAADVFPDLAGMRLALGLSEAQLAEYSSGEDKRAEEYRSVLNAARDRRESYLVRAMTADNKRTSGCMNALKQRENGGYADKDTGEPTLNINVIGIPGGMEAFR